MMGRSHVISAELSIATLVAQCMPKGTALSSTSCYVLHSQAARQQRRQHSHRRHLSSGTSKDAPVALQAPVDSLLQSKPAQNPPITTPQAMPLATIPLSQVLRTFFITSISSSPTLLQASSTLLRFMLESRNPLFRIDTNPILRALLWETFYKQFCAGSNKVQISKVCDDLRRQGYSGVILEYALEVLKDNGSSDEAADIATWREGVLKSIEMSAAGDYVGLKWSGMGPAAMRRMKDEQPPSQAMGEAMHAVCRAAAAKDVILLPAAEETWNLNGFHAWSLGLQRQYNLGGKSIVFNTYQAYLKQTPGTLAEHMAIAEAEGFTLGAKLVRGAYLATEKRELIWPSIESTHHAYDETMSALLQRKYNDVLTPAASVKATSYPALNVVLATHNAATVNKALAIRKEQRRNAEALTPLAFAQLQGMADEVSLDLIMKSQSTDGKSEEKVIKCSAWGTMYECLNYLLRRAAENKDAASRTVDTRKAMASELFRRMRGAFGLA